MVQVLLIVAVVAIVSAVLYSLFGQATDYSQAAMNGHEASRGSTARTITSTKDIAQAGALYASDYGVAAPLSIHPVIADGYLTTEEIVHPDDKHPLGQGGACRAFVHEINMRALNTSSTPPVGYRFSYWGRGDLGQGEDALRKNADFLSKGTDPGWLVYILDFDPDATVFPPPTKEDVPFMRFLIDGGVVTRNYKTYSVGSDPGAGQSFTSIETFFADYTEADIIANGP